MMSLWLSRELSSWEQFCDVARLWSVFLFFCKFLGQKKLHRAGELLCKRKQKGEERGVGWMALKGNAYRS